MSTLEKMIESGRKAFTRNDSGTVPTMSALHQALKLLTDWVREFFGPEIAPLVDLGRKIGPLFVAAGYTHSLAVRLPNGGEIWALAECLCDQASSWRIKTQQHGALYSVPRWGLQHCVTHTDEVGGPWAVVQTGTEWAYRLDVALYSAQTQGAEKQRLIEEAAKRNKDIRQSNQPEARLPVLKVDVGDTIRLISKRVPFDPDYCTVFEVIESDDFGALIQVRELGRQLQAAVIPFSLSPQQEAQDASA